VSEAKPTRRIAGVLHVERRNAARYGVRLRLLFPWGDRIMQAQTNDLSATGMQIESLANLAPGTGLVMHFAPTGEKITQRVEGGVVWTRPPKAGSALYTSGFRFSALSAEAKASIDQILSEHSDELPEVGADDVVEVPGSAPQEDAVQIASQLKLAVHVDQGRHAERRREADALMTEAQRAVAGGSLAKATRLLEQALELAPDSREVMEELARVLYLKGEIARAAELFDKALRVAQETNG
jgi:hypothetical protein